MVCGDSNKSSTLKELLCSISHYLIYIYWFNVYHLYKNVRFLENGWFVHCWITAPDKYFVKEWKGKTRQGSLGLYTWLTGCPVLKHYKDYERRKRLVSGWNVPELSLSPLGVHSMAPGWDFCTSPPLTFGTRQAFVVCVGGWPTHHRMSSCTLGLHLLSIRSTCQSWQWLQILPNIFEGQHGPQLRTPGLGALSLGQAGTRVSSHLSPGLPTERADSFYKSNPTE